MYYFVNFVFVEMDNYSIYNIIIKWFFFYYFLYDENWSGPFENNQDPSKLSLKESTLKWSVS